MPHEQPEIRVWSKPRRRSPTVREQSPDFGDDASQQGEVGTPADVSRVGYQDIPGLREVA